MKKIYSILASLSVVFIIANKEYLYLPQIPNHIASLTSTIDDFKQSIELAINDTFEMESYKDPAPLDYFLRRYKYPLLLILKEQSLTDLALEWVKPIVKKKMEHLDMITRIHFYLTVNHGIGYLQNFNYPFEQSYFDAISNAPSDLFYRQSPSSFLIRNGSTLIRKILSMITVK